MAVNKALEIAKIKKAEFTELITDLESDSFFYFDPPDRPISKTAGFNVYNKYGFSDMEQIQLAQLFKQTDRHGLKVMMCNSDLKNSDPKDNFFNEIYCDFNIVRVCAQRMINSDSTKHGTINEIIVTNYTTI